MRKRRFCHAQKISLLCGVLLFLDGPRLLMGESTSAAVAAFHIYCQTVEARLMKQHTSPSSFLAAMPTDSRSADARMRQGEVLLQTVDETGGKPSRDADFAGSLLHHWRGTAFARGAKAADFERLMRDFDSYPQHFSPQVLQAKVLQQSGNHMQASMRVRQRHVITVVMDSTYDITFGQLDVHHGYSISQSTRIGEIDGVGTPSEHMLSAQEEHGFLWQLNTYWSYEERDGGLYLQIEAVSLTRSIPHGLGWVIRPYVESVPRESIEFTLRSACNAIRK